MKEIIGKIFPKITGRAEEKQDVKFWFWLIINAAILLLTASVIQQLNLKPFARIADIMKWIVPAYMVVSIIPLRFRPAAFVAFLVAVVLIIFGAICGSILLLLVLICFVILQLPVNIYLRAFLMAGFLISLGLLRSGFIQMPRIQMALPYVAALIMFRSLVWLHEAQHHPMKENLWLRLSYFFCLPNLAFLFFPIVDYRIHVQFYYNVPSLQIWRKGMVFIFSGILQFVLYRVIHNTFNISTDQIYNSFDLAHLLVVNYSSLLQFSGALTAGVGFLCLFGFNLPTPFGNFYFAESFFKYWQKVNIYWNEFLLKVAYYPTYFALRKKTSFATEISLLVVFTLTTFLHWYQKFWITGITKIPVNDIVFWSLLGVLIIGNAIYNRKFPAAVNESGFWKKHAGIAFRTSMVFAVMCVLTWFWTAESFKECKYILEKSLGNSSVYFEIPLLLLFLFLINFCISAAWSFVPTKNSETQSYFFPLLTAWLFLLAVAIGLQAGVQNFWTTTLSKEIKSPYEIEFDEVDYYTSILDNSSGLWVTKLASNAISKHLKIYSVETGDLLMRKLIPGATKVEDGATMHVNSFGMRDKEYTLEKPAGIYRYALLGGSYELGSGVDDWCVYESVVEKEMNKNGKKVEFLNLSMGGYTTMQYVYLMDTKVPTFHPDAVILFSHVRDPKRYGVFLCRYVQNGIDLHYPYLKNVIERSGATQQMSPTELRARIEPFVEEVMQWSYDTLDVMCRKNNIRPIWVYAPTTTDTLNKELYLQQKSWAEKAGFECYTIHDAFEGYTPEQLRVSEENTHPNCMGHRLLADKFSKIISIIDSTRKR